MNYEQKYNELVNAIKVLQETNPSDEGIQNWVNDNVPELRESEDESTRKRIIALVNSHGQGRFKETMIAWLEKQGTSYTKRDIDDAYVEGMAFAKNELEKQKPANWSEEDERMYNIVFEEYKNRQYYSHPTLEDYDISGQILGWLKSLKDRVIPQQKSAWSEEDEKMNDLIISVLEVNHSKGIFKVGLRAIRTEEIVSWLITLKQRYTWKPSKEQMDAMQMAVSYFGYSWTSKEQKLLESLYKDLKKLTEG